MAEEKQTMPTQAMKPVIKAVDMSEQLQEAAVEIAQKAFEQHKIEKDIAQYIKKEFDRQFGATWHAIVGKNFGSFVTHETGNFIYYYMGNVAIVSCLEQKRCPVTLTSK